ncbi:MAG: hypothetical protein ABIU97_00985, partial [Dehalococcoidia bacterium]
AVLTVTGGPLTNGVGGTLTALAGANGPRTLVAVLDNQGTVTVRPGSAGTLAINGSLTTSGMIDMELGGLSAGSQYDQIIVTGGTVTLGGTLNVTSINSFTPVALNSFTVLTFPSVTGTFATIIPPAGVILTPAYNPSSVVVTVQ